MADGTKRQARKIPEATVARLPLYLRSLLEVAGDATPTISSERLAELSGVNAAKVRKDLSYLGSYGTRGVGYDVEYLLFQMSRELGLTKDWHVVIAGLGNLGHALANYAGFSDILNFAPTTVSVPPDVSLRKVDLAVELQILSFYQQRKGAETAAAAAGRRPPGTEPQPAGAPPPT
jgi:NADH/NAD ratio-sensing transcriptional regulator Rex